MLRGFHLRATFRKPKYILQQYAFFLKQNKGKKKVAPVLLKKVGGNNRPSQNEQICHKGLCNILNLKEKSFQTFEIFI